MSEVLNESFQKCMGLCRECRQNWINLENMGYKNKEKWENWRKKRKRRKWEEFGNRWEKREEIGVVKLNQKVKDTC